MHSAKVDFYDRNIVSMRDLTRKDIEYLMDLAETTIPYARGDRVNHSLKGKILRNLFLSRLREQGFHLKVQRTDSVLMFHKYPRHLSPKVRHLQILFV